MVSNRDDLERLASNCAGVVKLITGVGNNAAWIVMMEGYDAARRCKAYRRSVKGGHNVGWYFMRAINKFKEYEHNLLYAQENRMFHVADMYESVRRKYGDITDAQFYEFWKGIGGQAYAKTKPMITSLWNKYRVSLCSHNMKQAEHIAWVLTTQAALDLAITMYESAITECATGAKIPRKMLDALFGQFSLRRVSMAWRTAMMNLAPELEPLQLDPVEEKNISLGLQQLMEAWTEPDLLYGSTMETVEDYDEIFASKGFQKRVLREIEEVRADTIKHYQET